MLNFREYIQKIEEMNTIGVHNDGPAGPFNGGRSGGGYLPTNWTGSEADAKWTGHAINLPGTDLQIPSDVPTRKVSERITHVDDKGNNILVILADGTRLYFTRDEADRITGGRYQELRRGRTLSVIFQRHPKDNSNNPSQVQSAQLV